MAAGRQHLSVDAEKTGRILFFEAAGAPQRWNFMRRCKLSETDLKRYVKRIFCVAAPPLSREGLGQGVAPIVRCRYCAASGLNSERVVIAEYSTRRCARVNVCGQYSPDGKLSADQYTLLATPTSRPRLR